MRKILITGASGGIGEAICDSLGLKHELFVLGRNKSKIKNLCQKYKFIKGSFVCDLSDENQIYKTINEINKNSIDFDILINNAGVTDDALFLRMDLEKWKHVVDTNSKSNFLLSSALSKNMIKKKWGRIINITSVVGHTGNYGQSNYCASKAGILGMSKSIALELAKRNITVNCIAPGFIETSMTAVLSESQRESLIDKIPMGKIGSPVDVANCVEFLVSDKSEYITGQTIHVNGGLAML